MEEEDPEPRTQPAGDLPPPRPPRPTAVGLESGDDGSGKKRQATITQAATGEGLFSRKSGGKGQHGHVVLRIEPNARNGGVEIISTVPAELLPAQFVASAGEGVRQALQSGVSIGDPAMDNHAVVDVVVHVTGGSFDPDDSSDLAFKMAGFFAVRNALKLAAPIELG
ncbi:MAG TPA: hypothetical protein VFE31_08485 [Opitutaceae bacterium]|jgi:elongation factor G|nr:hypothetical protein [Opitutaceae bacterium]